MSSLFKDVTFEQLIGKVRAGGHPVAVIEESMMIGPDRKDDIVDDESKVREFTRIASMYASAYPYVGPDWINTIADQVRHADADGMRELIKMATENRNQYAGSVRIDAGGSFQLWDAILKGLLAVQGNYPPGTYVPRLGEGIEDTRKTFKDRIMDIEKKFAKSRFSDHVSGKHYPEDEGIDTESLLARTAEPRVYKKMPPEVTAELMKKITGKSLEQIRNRPLGEIFRR